MKNFFIIIIIFIFSTSASAKKFIKVPKDVGSGSKYTKSLTGKGYKKHGFQIVNKEDGHPVRAGNQSIRFEVRHGDCGMDKDGWSDCKNDRERHELSTIGSPMSSGEYWFSWSIYFPKDHQNLYPLSNAFGQFHQKDGNPVFMFKELKKGYTIVRTITDKDSDYHEQNLLTNDEVLGKWSDILINVKWSKKEDGFFKIWVNDELKYDYVGPTKSKQKVYQKFGIYRTGISRYLNYINIDKVEKCFNEKGKTDKEYKSFVRLKLRKFPGHQTSIDIYKKCKGYYETNNVPTTIIYFDEVRKGKSKDKVGIIQ